MGFSPLGKHITRGSWQFIFEWVAGGESWDLMPSPKVSPWWLSEPSAASLPECGFEDAEEAVALAHPFSLLPSYFTIPRTLEGKAIPISSSTALTRKGWRCGGCGKLNVQRLLCVQKCDKCEVRCSLVDGPTNADQDMS